VRGGPSPSYASIGSIVAREIVTVLRLEWDWYLIEYWTSGGNKRGYVQSSNIYVPRYYRYEAMPNAELTYDGGTNLALYAHMSQFVGGYQACTYPNYKLDNSPFTRVLVNQTPLAVGYDSLVGYSGDSGNCYPTGGAHLHFELYGEGTRNDPFTYVLFAKMPK
jgi:hypothetical protein